MDSPSSMTLQGQQPQAQAVQPGPPAEWSPSEYAGPSQLPIAVVSIACGLVIVLLIAYVAYLQRSRWESMVDEGRKKLRRLTGSRPFPIFQDDLVERLDALEKALRQEASPVNAPISKSPSSETISELSLRSGDSSFNKSTRDRKLSRSSSFRSPPAFPLLTNSSTIEANLMSEKSFYSQTRNSFNLLSSPLPIIQIHPVDSSMSVYSSFEQKSRPRSLSAPSPHPKQYSQLGDTPDESTPSRFILPEEPQPSFSSMLKRFTMDTLGEDVDADIFTLNQDLSPTWGSPLLRSDAREAECLWEENPFDSSLHIPIPSPSTPSTSGFNLSFEQLRRRLDVVRRSAIFSTESIRTTLDDIHEDIKRSYDVFLSMLDDGLFDTPENSPHMKHLKRVDPAIFRDSRADPPSATDVTEREIEGMDEEGAKEFNTRFISMLIDDLKHHTSKTSNSSRGLDFPPRSQNPVISQLENGDIPIVCLEGLGPSPRSEAPPDSPMGSPYTGPTPIFSRMRSFSTISDASPFNPRHNLAPLHAKNPIVQRSPQQMDRSSIVSANRFSTFASRPLLGDLHLRKLDFDPRLDSGMFGFGRAAAWNPSDSPNNQVYGRGQSTASCSSQGSSFEGRPDALQGSFATAPLTQSSKTERSKSLPNIDSDRRFQSILSPSPTLPPGLGLAYPRSEIAYYQRRTSSRSAEKWRSIVSVPMSRLSPASLNRFRGTELSPVSRPPNRQNKGPASDVDLN